MFLKKIINLFLIVTIISANCVGNANLRSLQPQAFASSSIQNNKIAIASNIELTSGDKKRIRESLTLEVGINLDEKSLAKIDVNLSSDVRQKIKDLFLILTLDEKKKLAEINLETIFKKDTLGIGYEISKKLPFVRYNIEIFLNQNFGVENFLEPQVSTISKIEMLKKQARERSEKLAKLYCLIPNVLKKDFGVKKFSSQPVVQLAKISDGWIDYAKYIQYKTAGYVMPDLNGDSVSAILSQRPEMLAIQEGARLDTIIGRQASGFGAQIGELISNGLDAMGLPSIGRFGFGFNQIFKKLEEDDDRVVVYTRGENKNFGRQIIFKKVGDRILFQDKKIDGLQIGGRQNGTRVEVQKTLKITSVKKAEILKTIHEKYLWNDVVKINLYTESGAEIVNKLDYEIIDGKSEYKTSGEVNVFVGETGFVVEDSGKGMDDEVIFEHLIKPRTSTKERVEGGQFLKYKAGEKNALIECNLDLLVGGVRVQGYKFTGLNLPKELAIDLGYDVDLGSDRSRINFNEKVIASLSLLIDKVIAYQGENRYQIFNAMSELIRQMQDDIKEKNPVVYSEFFNLKEKIRLEVQKVAREGKTKFFISRAGMEKLELAKMVGLEFIDRDLYDIDILRQSHLINGLDELSSELYTGYNGYKLFVGDFCDQIQDVYLDINLGNRGGAIIVDRKIYEKYKLRPEMLNMLINMWIGYGQKLEKKVELKVWKEGKVKLKLEVISELFDDKILNEFGVEVINNVYNLFECAEIVYLRGNERLFTKLGEKFVSIDEISDNVISIKKFGGIIYISTNKGLYKKEKLGEKFVKIEEINNKILDLQEFRGVVYVLTNKGLYKKETFEEKFVLVNGSDVGFNEIQEFNGTLYLVSEAEQLYKKEPGENFIDLVNEINGNVFKIKEVDGTVYVLTDEGLYKKEKFKEIFVKVKEIKGAVFDIREIAEILYLKSKKGLYKKEKLMCMFVKVEEIKGCLLRNMCDNMKEFGGIVYCGTTHSLYKKEEQLGGKFVLVNEEKGSAGNFIEFGETLYVIRESCLYKKEKAEENFFQVNEIKERVKAIQKYGEIVYVATMNGLYKKSKLDKNFSTVGGIYGHVLSIKEIDGIVLISFAEDRDRIFTITGNKAKEIKKLNYKDNHYMSSFSGLTSQNKEQIKNLIDAFVKLEQIDDKYKGDFMFYLFENGLPESVDLTQNINKYMFSILGDKINDLKLQKKLEKVTFFIDANSEFFNNWEKSKIYWKIFKFVYNLASDEKSLDLLMGRIKDLLSGDMNFAKEFLTKLENENWDKYFIPAELADVPEEVKIIRNFLTSEDLNFEDMRYQNIELAGNKKLKDIPLGSFIMLKATQPLVAIAEMVGKLEQKKLTIEDIRAKIAQVNGQEDTSYRSVVDSQNIDKNVYLRELIQNSRDAYNGQVGEKTITIADGFETLENGDQNYVVSVQDKVGMNIEQVLNDLLIPDVSTKIGTGSTGLFGIGFFTVFQDADEVVIRTGKGNGISWRITTKVERFPNGKIDKIKISKLEEYNDNYKGTNIEVKKRIQSKISAYIERMGLKMRLMQYVGGVNKKIYRRDKNGIVANSEILEKTADVKYNGIEITEERELISEIDTNYGRMRLMLRRDKTGKYTQAGYIEQKGLYVSPIERSLLKYVPKELLESLSEEDRRSLIIEIPAGMKLTSSRGVVMQEGEELEKIVATAIYKWLVCEYLQKGKRLYGLSEDYFWESGATNYESSQEIQTDAENLNRGNYEAVDIGKYVENMKNMLSLITLIKDPFRGKSISEVKKIIEQEKQQERSGVVSGVDAIVALILEIPAIAEISREYKNRPTIATEAIKESDMTEEQYVLRNFLEQMLKLGFKKIGFCFINDGSDNGYYPVLEPNSGNILWNMDFNIVGVTQKFLEKIRKGEKIDDLFYDGSMEGFFETYWHEWTHTREYENYLNEALKEIDGLSGVDEHLKSTLKEEVKKYWIGYFSSGQGGHRDKSKVLDILNELKPVNNQEQITKISFMVETMYFEMSNFSTHQSEKRLKGGFADIMHGELTKFVRASTDIDFNELLEKAKIDGKAEYLLKSLDKSLLEKIKILINKILLDGKQEESVSIKANSAMMKAS
jgi:hypothetical protein